MPAPEPRLELGRDVAFSAGVAIGAPLDRSAGSAPAIARPSRTLVEADAALVSTGPSASGGFRSAPLPPRVPRQTGPVGTPSQGYGDWTRPSRSEETDPVDGGATADGDATADGPVSAAPGTTLIPERRGAGRRRRQAAPVPDSVDPEIDSSDEHRAPAPVRGPASGPVMGGRAAMRAERQAADTARRKAEKRTGSAVAVLDELDADGQVRKPRRVVKGLLAMTVVALGVLGVYSFVSPETKDAAASSPATAGSPAVAPGVAAPLPSLPSAPVEVAPEAVTPVRAPITVVNATATTGLAAKGAAAFTAAGWETAGVGTYQANDVAASTVFFTEGDETQRQAAVQLVDAFPQLQGPAVRFFELPADVAAPGLVVVMAGDWTP